MEAILNRIKKNAPLGYIEFEAFLKDSYESLFEFHKLTIDSAPFEILIGFFIVFFDKNQIEFTLGSTDKIIISESVSEAFIEFEKVIGHYS